MYYSNDYLCHYGVLGMKWGQHLMARKQASSQRKAKIAKGKSLTSKKEQRRTTALNVATTGMAGVAGLKVGVKIGSALMDQTVKTVATHQVSAYGATLGNAMLTGIKVASVSSTAPYLAGALALSALTAGTAYAISKHATNKNYIKKADESKSPKETSLRDSEYLDDHGDVRDKKTGKMVYN